MKKYEVINGVLHIDEQPDIHKRKYLCGTVKEEPNTWVTPKQAAHANKVQDDKYPLTITNFTYNGFFGKTLNGLTKYKARFNQWTNDPGIVLCDCSDGKQRLIPTFAMDISFILPHQSIKEGEMQLFGIASKS
jgi:hypothetical protein